MNTSLWFSANPDKAWVEKLFLVYSPVWMLIMLAAMVFGWDTSFSDAGLLILSLVVALPILLLPALLAKKYSATPWRQSYWLKANIYLFVFSVFGNYFGSEYFFDVLGMVYNFPNATTNLDAALVGSGRQQVPLIMYFLTHAYFMTYHATANIVLRRLRNLKLPGGIALFGLFVFVIGYVWAFLETKAMANPLMEGNFHYEKMEVMLAYGSAIYALYFIASFPIYYFIDEDKGRSWSLLQVTAGGLSASMLTFFLLDIAAHWVGSL
ncbi:MAG TPA: hypothetical protein VIN71_10250 [Pseudomonadales bacterium]